MTTYTAIPDASLEPGKPARSVDAILLRDNPIAITEGAAGAPRIEFAAMSHAGAVGAVGTWAFLKLTSGTAVAGDTRAGSILRYSDNINASGGTPSGTWRCMGIISGVNFASCWLRIV